jgi:hypothetical protein
MFLQMNEKINVFCIDHYFHHEQLNCKKYMLVCSNDIYRFLYELILSTNSTMFMKNAK